MGVRKNGCPRRRHACLLLSHVFFLAPIYFLAPAMQARCLYGLQGVLKINFLQVTIMSTPVQLCADKNGLFIFSGRKRQQMRQTGQSRPTEKCKTNCIKHCLVKSTTVKAWTCTLFLHHKTTSISLHTAADSRVEQNR